MSDVAAVRCRKSWRRILSMMVAWRSTPGNAASRNDAAHLALQQRKLQPWSGDSWSGNALVVPATFDLDAEPESFDFVTTFDAVHDQARPLAMLRGIRRALRSDGVYLMQDIQGSSHVHENIDHPGAPLLYMISCMHCMTVSLAQGGDERAVRRLVGAERLRARIDRGRDQRHAVSRNSSRPISMRRISEVPAPIS